MIPKHKFLHLQGQNDHEAWSQKPYDSLKNTAQTNGSKIAIRSINGDQLSYAQLVTKIAATSDYLLQHGIGRGDVVLVMLPNGADFLIALLGVMSTAVALPLATDEPLDSINKLIEELPVKAIIYDQRYPKLPEKICALHSVQMIPISSHPLEPGYILPELLNSKPALIAEPSEPNDTAVIGRTSGTMGKYQLIAWSQASIYLSAAKAAQWMELSDKDRSLCLMPFITMHTLVRSCLPILLSEGTVICTPGFDKNNALLWIKQHKPTFITAVPGIFRELIKQTQGIKFESELRFLAAGSDYLDTDTAIQLSHLFDVEVREFYGMNEVSPMLAGSPKGRPTGERNLTPLQPWKIRILSQNNAENRNLGELTVSGGIINPALNSVSSEEHTFFRTGDLVSQADDGSFNIQGRVDDRINRGGKKVFPEIIEAVIKQHPCVCDAIVFPINEHVLGQRIGAAVIQSQAISERELRSFLANQLTDFMVPEVIKFVTSIPLTKIGKVSRKKMADQLGVTWQDQSLHNNATREASSSTEKILLDIIKEVTGINELGVDDNFMALGADSFSATVLLVEIEEKFGILLTPGQFLANSSASGLAEQLAQAGLSNTTHLVKLKDGTDEYPPLFFAHGPAGHFYYASHFATFLDEKQSLYGLHKSEKKESMEEYAAQFAAEIRAIYPQGPYLLAGHSFGGQLAFEVAQQLILAGGQVIFLGIIDDEADLFKRKFGISLLPDADNSTQAYAKGILDRYITKPYPGDIDLFIAYEAPLENLADPFLGWKYLSAGNVSAISVPGDHSSMMSKHNISRWGKQFAERIEHAISNASHSQESWQDRLNQIHSANQSYICSALISARSAAKLGNLQEEIRWYNKAINADPNQPYWVYRNMANACQQAGQKKRAINLFRLAMEKEELPILGAIELAQALHKAQKPETNESISLLREAEKRLPNDKHQIKAWRKLTLAWQQIGQSSEALRCSEHVLSFSQDHNAKLLRSNILISVKQYSKALQITHEILAAAPDTLQAHIQEAKIALALKQPENALASLARAEQLNTGLDNINNIYQLKTKAYLLQGNDKLALEMATIVYQRNPYLPESTFNYVNCLVQSGELKPAIEALENLLTKQPNSIKALKELSNLHLRMGQGRQAIHKLTHTLQSRPDNIEIQLLLVQAYRSQKEWKNLLSRAMQILKKNPTHYALWFGLVKILVSRKR